MKIAGFEFSEGSRFQAGAHRDPNAVGDHMEILRKRSKGKLTPDDILSDARNNNSPLHSFFEWSNTKAAQQHRLAQARGLIRSVVAVYVDNGKPKAKQRAYVHISEENGQHYREVTDAMSKKETRELVLKSAWRELQTWRKKYADMKEFANLVELVDELAKELPVSARQ